MHVVIIAPSLLCCCRERKLERLPEAHLFVGRTPLSLADIRAWNTLREQVGGGPGGWAGGCGNRRQQLLLLH